MAVIVSSAAPQKLWAAIKTAIEQAQIETWEFDNSKAFITHKAVQWAKKAWLKPSVSNTTLTFNIMHPRGAKISTEVYAEYHALIIRLLLAKYDQMFSNVTATALPKIGDVVSTGP